MTNKLIADHVEKGLDELEKIADRTLEHAAITSAQAVFYLTRFPLRNRSESPII